MASSPRSSPRRRRWQGVSARGAHHIPKSQPVKSTAQNLRGPTRLASTLNALERSEAIQAANKDWIASSLALLAITEVASGKQRTSINPHKIGAGEAARRC